MFTSSLKDDFKLQQKSSTHLLGATFQCPPLGYFFLFYCTPMLFIGFYHRIMQICYGEYCYLLTWTASRISLSLHSERGWCWYTHELSRACCPCSSSGRLYSSEKRAPSKLMADKEELEHTRSREGVSNVASGPPGSHTQEKKATLHWDSQSEKWRRGTGWLCWRFCLEIWHVNINIILPNLCDCKCLTIIVHEGKFCKCWH